MSDFLNHPLVSFSTAMEYGNSESAVEMDYNDGDEDSNGDAC